MNKPAESVGMNDDMLQPLLNQCITMVWNAAIEAAMELAKDYDCYMHIKGLEK